MPNNNKKIVIFAAWITVLGALAFAVNRLSQMPDSVPQPYQIPKVDAVKLAKNWDQILKHASSPKGSLTAPYTLVEFGDFECPDCFHARPLLEAVLKNAPVNLYFVQRPIQGHRYAVAAAQAALAANAHGKFWQMYDSLYMHQKVLEPGFYSDYAAGIGLNGAALQKDVEGKRYLNQVEDSAKFCDSLGVIGTPTVALRDNRTGVVSAVSGSRLIADLLRKASWNTAPPAPASAATVSSNASQKG